MLRRIDLNRDKVLDAEELKTLDGGCCNVVKTPEISHAIRLSVESRRLVVSSLFRQEFDSSVSLGE